MQLGYAVADAKELLRQEVQRDAHVLPSRGLEVSGLRRTNVGQAGQDAAPPAHQRAGQCIRGKTAGLLLARIELAVAHPVLSPVEAAAHREAVVLDHVVLIL